FSSPSKSRDSVVSKQDSDFELEPEDDLNLLSEHVSEQNQSDQSVPPPLPAMTHGTTEQFDDDSPMRTIDSPAAESKASSSQTEAITQEQPQKRPKHALSQKSARQ